MYCMQFLTTMLTVALALPALGQDEPLVFQAVHVAPAQRVPLALKLAVRWQAITAVLCAVGLHACGALVHQGVLAKHQLNIPEHQLEVAQLQLIRPHAARLAQVHTHGRFHLSVR